MSSVDEYFLSVEVPLAWPATACGECVGYECDRVVTFLDGFRSQNLLTS